MKRTLWQPLTVGLAAVLLALPAYAENTQTPETAAVPAAQATTVAEAAPTVQPATEAEAAPAQKEENKLAPYLGKKITKQIIAVIVFICHEEIFAFLKI